MYKLITKNYSTERPVSSKCPDCKKKNWTTQYIIRSDGRHLLIYKCEFCKLDWADICKPNPDKFGEIIKTGDVGILKTKKEKKMVMNQDDYKTHNIHTTPTQGIICPVCEIKMLSDVINLPGNDAQRKFKCLNCSSEWVENHGFIDYELLKNGVNDTKDRLTKFADNKSFSLVDTDFIIQHKEEIIKILKGD